MSKNNRFARVAAAGIAFQAGSAAIDSATIMAALVFQLTGSALAVGAVPAILRFGWLFPQLFVGFLAGRSGASMRYYVIGAFGRTAAIAALALTLAVMGNGPGLGLAVLLLWTLYAFVSGIVAVPYNDIVARSVPSDMRSRLLATRFFGGGILALGVAFLSDRLIQSIRFPLSYSAIFAMAALLMLISSVVFIAMGEPKSNPANAPAKKPTDFATYFRTGLKVFKDNPVFRRFVFAQWCGGAVLMAAPFYVVAAAQSGVGLEKVALLLIAQTSGALVSNIVWGWWGDHLGKQSLMRGIAIGRMLPPAIILIVWLTAGSTAGLPVFIAVFFGLGALANGLTIAVIGLLMEISPDESRPAYSGYFNAITAPAFLLPLLAGVLVTFFGTMVVFALSFCAALAQAVFISKLQIQARA